MGFRGRQVLALVLVAVAVGLATSVVHTLSMSGILIDGAYRDADQLAKLLYSEVARAIREGWPGDPADVLPADEGLSAQARAIIGYSPIVLDVAVVDEAGRVLFQGQPGQPEPGPTQRFAELREARPVTRLWRLWRGPTRLLLELPFTVDGKNRFGRVELGVSSILLRNQMLDAVVPSTAITVAVVLVACVVAFYVADRLIAPLETLRRELRRIDVGGQQPLDLQTDADIERVAGFFSSLSERLRTQAASADEGEGWLDAMVEGLGDDIVLVVDADGQLLSLNEPASRLLARARHEAQGRPLSSLLPAEHPLGKLVRECLDTRRSLAARTVEWADGGSNVRLWVQVHAVPGPRELRGAVLTARDAARLDKLGAQLSYAQKLAALGRLTSGVAHEVKNPLNSIVMQVALLRRRLGEEHDARRYLDAVQEEVQRLDRVIQGFLRFSRPEELKFESVDLGRVLEEQREGLTAPAAARGVEVTIELEPRLPAVFGSRDLLRQALDNLCSNALEAMPQGGKLALAARRAGGGNVLVTVEDTGCGISPADLSKIFNLFYTTKESGHGIGLSVVYRVAQLHGGEVAVESTPGTGTRFAIDLREVPA